MDPVESISFPNFLLAQSGVNAGVRRQLTRAAELPDWVLNTTDTLVSSNFQLRLWELLEHELAEPDIALQIGAVNTLGHFGVHDYLFRTAPTLGEGLARSEEYAELITTNVGFAVLGDPEEEAIADIRLLSGLGRGTQLATQFALAAVVTRARNATGRTVHPIRVRFRQPAPRRHDRFVEMFGTPRVDFGAPTDQITFRASDLSLPLRTADPVLAGILREHTAILPPPPRLEVTWSGQVHQALTLLLGDGRVTIDRVARYLATSRRSLQRRLADEGTTWTRELDRARAALLEQRIQLSPDDTQTALARRIGYADPGTLRRARHRWTSRS
ncbi:AraC family transcriptional regulator ligand-binding domain-containing protein [Nocardia sp. NPDC002869]|uniref:AraC family transcriptional regulator n=1 Tax=Nocardia sp. NPDC002869 TaxID=3161032 RepID=UPI00398C8B6C